jgi:hypothetical protein
MFSQGRLGTIAPSARFKQYLSRFSPIIFTGLVVYMVMYGLALIPLSNGGSDLIDADIPKSLMLLHGQNPYSIEPWASPYPPLLLLVDSGIIRLAGLVDPLSSVSVISQNLRIAGLFTSTAVATLIYLCVRKTTNNPIIPLGSAGLFLTLPALSISPLYFFHSDTFGYPILALSLVSLAARKYLIGISLLATATIFKIHPILALPLILVWVLRTKGFRATIPSIAASSTIVGLGLALPLVIPGYAQSVLGFNFSDNGSGTTLYALFGIVNNILPAQLQLTITTALTDQVWLAGTFALYTVIVATVWAKARMVGPVDVVLLGLLAWLVPLKIEYTHYVVWAIIPVIMRGRLKQTIPILGLLQTADTLSYWSWWPNTSPFPGIDAVFGLAASGLLYRILGLVALGFVWHSARFKIATHTKLTNGIPSSLGEPAREETPLIVLN